MCKWYRIAWRSKESEQTYYSEYCFTGFAAHRECERLNEKYKGDTHYWAEAKPEDEA